jgi:hypothetical protein
MFSRIDNSILSRPLALLISVCLLSWSFVPPASFEEVTLNAGTMVPLETMGIITSETILVGQSLDFKVSRDVKADGIVVIPAGSIARGQVMRAQHAKGLGKAGYIEVQIKSVTAVDGTDIYLAGGNLFQEGEDKQTLAIVLGVFVCILFLTLKGKDAMIPPGYGVVANVGANTVIAVN